MDFLTWLLHEHRASIRKGQCILLTSWSNAAVGVLVKEFVNRNKDQDALLLTLGKDFF